MSDKTKFKVGDGVIVIKEDESTPRVGEQGVVSEILHQSKVFDYRVTFGNRCYERYSSEELTLYEAARPEQGIRITAAQQRQPADLTPDEVLTLQDMATSDGGRNYLGRYSRYLPDYQKLVTLGFAEEVATDKSAYAYEITPAGRAHLAALTSAPADVPTAAVDTITVSLSDAYEIHTALVAQVIRLTEHIDDPDYEGNTDNLVRIIRETEAVLDRLTKQLQ